MGLCLDCVDFIVVCPTVYWSSDRQICVHTWLGVIYGVIYWIKLQWNLNVYCFVFEFILTSVFGVCVLADSERDSLDFW